MPGMFTAGQFFKAVNENNEGVLRSQVQIARRAERPPVGDLICDIDFVGYSDTPAKGLSLRAFAEALIAKGHDRCNIAEMLADAPTRAPKSGTEKLADTGAASMEHQVLGPLAPGDRLFHPSYQLVTVIGRDPGDFDQVICAQFNRNSKEIVVSIDELQPVPDPGEAVWQFTVMGGGGRLVRLIRFPALVEAELEEAWQAGAGWVAQPSIDEPGWATVPFELHNSDIARHESCTADLSQMVVVSSVGGFKRNIVRTEKNGSMLFPLSLVELEAAWTSKSLVQVKGKGRGRLLFVSADNAKIELDPSGRKTFCPLETIYSADADLDVLAAWTNRSFDFRSMVPVAMPDAAVAPRRFEQAPLTPEMAEQYRSDRSRSQWQYKPGTQWSAFPATTSEKLDDLFSEPPSEATIDQRPCLLLGTYRAKVIVGTAPDTLTGAQGSGQAPNFCARDLVTAVALNTDAQKQSSGKSLPPPVPGQPTPGRIPGLRLVFDSWLKHQQLPSSDGDVISEVGYRVNMDELKGGDLVKAARYIAASDLYLWAVDGCAEVFERVEQVAASFAAAIGRCDAVAVDKTATRSAESPNIPPGAVLCRIDRAVLEIAGRLVTDSAPTTATAAASGMHGYLIEVPASSERPIVISGNSIEGLERGLATLARSMIVQNCDGHRTAVLPACYVADLELSGRRGHHHFAVATTTEIQSMAQFVTFARLSREYEPSMSRSVRRAVQYSRRDGRRVVVKGRGLGTLVSFNAGEATMQFGRENNFSTKIRNPDLERFWLPELIVPPVGRSTGLDWAAVLFAEAASGGKGQVIFAEFPGQRCVVIKRTDEPASELACYRIGQLLGVPMPAVVVLHTGLGEGAAIEAALRRLQNQGRFKMASKGSGGAAQRQSCWLVVQEFQPGETVKDLCHRDQSGEQSWALGSFGPDEAGQLRLRAIGKMIALDIVVHNADRWYLPSIFESMSRCGNMANIVVSPSRDLIAIDNTCNAFDTSSPKSAAHFGSFIESVQKLAATTWARTRATTDQPGLGIGAAHPALENVRDFLRDGQGGSDHAAYIPPPGHDIGDAGTRQVEAGFMSVVVSLSEPGLRAAIQEVEIDVAAELGWLGSGDLHRVRSDFFLAVATALCAPLD